MIKEITLRCKISLGNYENIEVSVVGDNEIEIISQIKSTLSHLGNNHPETKDMVAAYTRRVFENNDAGVVTIPSRNPDKINDAIKPNENIKMSGKHCIKCGREVTVRDAEASSLFIAGGRVKCKECMMVVKKN